ncbi:MAG: ATP synthase F1 subunit gamma [Candidatus Latescibacteria bacterium]|nr:ATP synthase F1 subunit gamma [Candidatus Latescibacterota bacterium]
MATIREIRRRIIAIKSTQKITRAMQMVAAAKLRRAQENILKARPYAIQLDNIIAQVAIRSKRDLHPLLTERGNDRKLLLVLVTADSGLCGGFNSNIIKRARNYIDEHKGSEIDMFCIGRKGRDFFRKTDLKITAEKIMFFNHLKYSDAVETISGIKKLFLEEQYDRVDVMYNEFKSAIQQNLVTKQFLPLVPAEPEEDVLLTEYIYEPDEYSVFDTLIPYHLEVQMWRIMLESFASEMGAKMTAMDAATENASDLLNTLSITYNRARQALITKEISEIVGGAESLRT